MKRALSSSTARSTALVVAGTGLIAATYGLVRMAYGLFLPDVRAAFAMDAASAGHISSGASLVYCLAALGGLVAATHARRLVVGAIATASAGCLAMALAPGLPAFAAAAVLASAGAGLASPAMVVVVARNVAAAGRDRAQATVNAGTGPGLVLAGVMALVLLPHWRLALTVSAVATAAAGVAVLLLDRDGQAPDEAPDDAPDAPAADRSSPGWVRALAVPGLGALLLGTTSAVVWTYGRVQLEAEGASGSLSTLAWIALGLGGALTVTTSAVLSRWDPARAWLVSGLALAASIAALGLAAGRPAVAGPACVVFGWAFVAATSALIAWAAHAVPERAAAGTSLLFVTLVLGQAVGSSLAGEVAERTTLGAAFVLMAALTVPAAGLGWRRVSRPAPPRPRAPARLGSG